MALVRRHGRPSSLLGGAIHAGDVLAAVFLTLFTEGPTSPFFVFFGFVLLATAYRWGFWETVATGGVIVLLFGVEALLVSGSHWPGGVVEGQFELNRFIIRCAYLVLLAVAVGYIAEEEKSGRAEIAVLASALSRAQRAGSFRATLELVANEVIRIFRARALCLLVEELSTGRLFLWEGSRSAGGEGAVLQMTEIGAAERDAYTLPTEAPDCLVVGRTRSSGCEVLVSNGAGRRPTRLPVPPSAAFLAGRSFDLVLSVAQALGDDWQTRLFVLDPDVSHGGVRALGALGSLVRYLGPVAHSAYLVSRLRSHVRAIERARLAREIHDGVVQSLIGIKMQLEALRLRARRDSNLRAEIARIEELLQREALNLRMLMLELTPTEVRPNRLPVMLADLVERFDRASGISSRFISELDDLEAPPQVCREIARILQEALINIRKHGRASSVLVRLSALNGSWILAVVDDGRGFDFSGRLSHEELDRARKGPRVIKERVRLLNGSLVVESKPGAGSRLEITIPQQAVSRNV